jgi:hypothetical protein
MRRAAVAMIWRKRNEISGKNKALGFSIQRHEQYRCDSGALKRDRNRQSTPANTALAFALFRIAFYETPVKSTEGFFGIVLLLESHHTPPHGIAARGTRNFCGAGFLWVALLLQDPGAALAGM